MYTQIKVCLLIGIVGIIFFGELSIAQEASGEMSMDSELTVSADQYLNPQKLVILSAEVSGVVDRIHYSPGDFVKEGDVLVQLNTDMVQLKVQQLKSQIEMDTQREEARITLDYRKSNLEIVQQLFDTQLESGRVGSRKELEESKQMKEIAELGKTKAQLNLRLLNLELQQNQKLLDRHSIKAPFDGVVVPFSSVQYLESRNLKRLEEGEAVQAGQVVMALMKVDRLRVEWTVPIEQINRIQLGQKTRVVIQYPEIAEIGAQVIYISPTVELTREFKVEAEFDNPLISKSHFQKGEYRYRFRPGMGARVVLE